MRFRRIYYSPDGDTGSTNILDKDEDLEGNDITDKDVGDIDDEDIDLPGDKDDKDSGGDADGDTDKATGASDGSATDGDDDDDSPAAIFTAAADQLEGIGIDVEELKAIDFGDGIEGVAKFAKEVAERTTKAEAELFFQENPDVRELMVAKQQGREAEYYKLKAEGAEIPLTVEEDKTEQHKEIITKHYIKQGFSPALAAKKAEQSVLGETSYEEAKEIVDITNASIKERNEAAAAAKLAEEQKRIDAIQEAARVEKEIVDKGNVGNVKIPFAERDKFNAWRLHRSGDKEYPNASLKQIKEANLNVEQRLMLDWALYAMTEKGLDFSKLILADSKTKEIKLGKALGGKGQSKMGGSAVAAKKGVELDDDNE